MQCKYLFDESLKRFKIMEFIQEIILVLLLYSL